MPLRVFNRKAAARIGKFMGLGGASFVEVAQNVDGEICVVAHAKEAYAVLVVTPRTQAPSIRYWTYDRQGQEYYLREVNQFGVPYFAHYMGWDEAAGTTQGCRDIPLNNPRQFSENLIRLTRRVAAGVGTLLG